MVFPMASSDTPQHHDYDTATEKYDAASRRELAASGLAMPDGSYPVVDVEDLHHAIRAVGRGRHDSHDAIRRHIIARAQALGVRDAIPNYWSANGALTGAGHKR
jgi:hypothetical protein